MGELLLQRIQSRRSGTVQTRADCCSRHSGRSASISDEEDFHIKDGLINVLDHEIPKSINKSFKIKLLHKILSE